MDRQIEATQVSNTLNYLHLLPEDEQLNQLKTFLAYIKKIKHKYNKTIEHSPKYIKSLKRLKHLTFKNLK